MLSYVLSNVLLAHILAESGKIFLIFLPGRLYCDLIVTVICISFMTNEVDSLFMFVDHWVVLFTEISISSLLFY